MALAMPACLWSSGSASNSGGADESGSSSDDDGNGNGSATQASSATQGSGASGADTTGGEGSCYGDSDVGCTSLSWNDIATIIEALYLFDDSYYGYTKSEALELAHQLYDEGVVPGAWLRVLALQDLGNGRWRAHVAVAGADGHAVGDLDPSAFDVSFDGGDAIAPAVAYPLGEADPDDVHAELSVIVDDSGSITDCDAAFVQAGVTQLFDTVPPIYAASLIKFADDVYTAHARTEDTTALADAMASYCTDRGSTSLWDAIEAGVSDLPAFEGLRTVIVFTDGLDNDSDTSLSAVIDHAQAERVPVIVIGLGLADMFALSRLALETDGGLVYIHSGQQALTAFEVATSFVSDSYVVEVEADVPFESIRFTATLQGGATVSDAASPPS
ncbi:MAG TPA: VWA domain-containing protein [Nannocystaceae bacterium]|nr:VWA domain-containing protein [Nannocystaceae bacterium]